MQVVYLNTCFSSCILNLSEEAASTALCSNDHSGTKQVSHRLLISCNQNYKSNRQWKTIFSTKVSQNVNCSQYFARLALRLTKQRWSQCFLILYLFLPIQNINAFPYIVAYKETAIIIHSNNRRRSIFQMLSL